MSKETGGNQAATQSSGPDHGSASAKIELTNLASSSDHPEVETAKERLLAIILQWDMAERESRKSLGFASRYDEALDALLLAVRAEQDAEIRRLAESWRQAKLDEARWMQNYHDQKERAESAEAALKARGWQPIESAPKDGTVIDVYLGKADFPLRVTDVSWRVPTDSEFWTHGSSEPDVAEGTIGAGHDWFDPFGPLNESPTHWRWRPLPPAPVQADQETTE